MNPENKVAMTRKKGAKKVPKELCRTIYDKYWIGVRVTDIAKHYEIKQLTVSNIIRRLRNATKKTTEKKMGRPCKLSDRSMRLFKKYVTNNCYDPLYTIGAKFNETTGLIISERTGRR